MWSSLPRIAIAARSAFHVLGPPEGYLALAEMTGARLHVPEPEERASFAMMFRSVADETPKPRLASHNDDTGSPWAM